MSQALFDRYSELPWQTVDFRGSMAACYPRMVWQELFNIYRAEGGDLENMDNMLIDLKECELMFDKLSRGSSNRFYFVWSCDPGHFQTSWKEVPGDLNLSGFELWLACLNYEVNVLCEVSLEEMTSVVLSKQGLQRDGNAR
jgi:hypothetical protein